MSNADRPAPREHPNLELDECDQPEGMDYYTCPDCGGEFEALCAFANPLAVDRDPWARPKNEELTER